jgi:hypothetical protein
MMQRTITALLLLVQILAAVLAVQPVHAAGVGSLTGRVFVDANGNGLAEPGEAPLAQATVFVHLQGAAAPAVELTADAQGLFVLRNLDYGVYEVWAAADGVTVKGQMIVEIGEVNAAVVLDLPVYASADYNKTVAEGLLYLPLLRP